MDHHFENKVEGPERKNILTVMIKRTLLSLLSFFICLTIFAQDSSAVPMADELRRNGKIYVVVAVILTIFIGIILYLIRLDRKISKLENNNS
jgi:uncharacterized membrane protein (DUF485 family)